MTNENKIRNEKTGQYSNKLSALCRCGKTKGEHTAAAPYTIDDFGHYCEGFKKPRKKSAREIEREFFGDVLGED